MAPCTLALFVTSCVAHMVIAHQLSSDDYSDDMEEDQMKRRVNSIYARSGAGEEERQHGLPVEGDTELKAAVTTSTTTTTTTSTTTTPPTLEPKTTAVDRRYRRIYNADETVSIKDYPFLAAVLVNRELWCGGVILEQDRILTAAHCLQLQYNNRFFREYVKMLTVRVGSTNATSGGEVLRVTDIFFHPNYKPQNLDFNFAVLKLHRKITFTNDKVSINKIAYSRDSVIPYNRNISFLGWGSVWGDGGGVGGQVLLQKVELPVYELADCQEVYGRDLVSRTNFCAGYISKMKNVCNHDAGGPAILDNLLVGILSFSNKRCDEADKPAVFSRVGAVAGWLDSLTDSMNMGIKFI